MSRASDSQETPVAETRGRPRSTKADAAILDAALRMLDDVGYQAMSMEAVAAEAGVGKTTVYRRYANKAELASAAIKTQLNVETPPDTGHIRTDLIALIDEAVQFFEEKPGFRAMCSLLTEQAREPGLIDTFHERVTSHRRQIVLRVFEQAIERGQVKPNADIRAAMDMLMGAALARRVSCRPRPPGWSTSVVDIALGGLAPN